MKRLPVHVTPGSEERRGEAPYNFVPLPERVMTVEAPFREHDRWDGDRLHGWIELDIVTETETYTRCAHAPEGDGQDRQHFYHHGDADSPVIPGSSLRGMIRSLVEILAYSRLTRRPEPGRAVRTVDDYLMYRAVADQRTSVGKQYNQQFLQPLKGGGFRCPHSNVQAGYLERVPSTGGWKIVPAQALPDGPGASTFARVSLQDLTGISTHSNSADQVVHVVPEPVRSHRHRRLELHYARISGLDRQGGPGFTPARLVCSGDIRTRKMHTVVYPRDPKAAPLLIPAETWETYERDRDLKRGLPNRKLDHDAPVFYLVDEAGQLVFFGPTLFFRIPYRHRTGDFVPESGSDLDLAESIFGTISQDGPFRGRVSFDDALFQRSQDGSPPFLEGGVKNNLAGTRIPGILSSPKPTSYQNYLVQTDPEGSKDRLLSYNDLDKTVGRGFKRYWHRGQPGPQDLREEAQEKETQLSIIRPVRPGTRFRGRVRFENLTYLELGALLAALELPDTCRHQLGMGKPLGLGTIKLTTRCRLFDPRLRYANLTTPGSLDHQTLSSRLDRARLTFRQAILGHHNQDGPVLPDQSSMWDVPRLGELKLLLEWEGRPSQQKTRYLSPKESRERQTLPTPSGVMGLSDPARPPTPSPGRARGQVPSEARTPSPASPSGPLPLERRSGRVVEFRWSGLKVQFEGEPRPVEVAVDARILRGWKALSGAELRPGTPVDVELQAGKVVGVLPVKPSL